MTFNTGRLYTALGQVITFEKHDDHVLFKDHSRLICGRIDDVPPLGVEIPKWVMSHYDKNNYRMSTEAIGLDQSDTIHNVRL
jgi:hypothetical protein